MARGEIRTLLLFLGAAVLLVVVAVVVAAVVVGEGENGVLVSQRGVVRPWAEGEYDALVAPVASAGRGGEPRYLAELKGVEWEEDASDPTRGRLTVRVRKPGEVWVPGYEVLVLDGSNGYRVADGAWSVVVERVEVDVRDGVSEAKIFSPVMAPMDAGGGGRTGTSRFGMGADGPVTGFSVSLGGEGWAGSGVMARGMFDRATKVQLSNGVGVMDTGKERSIYGELRCLHDAELRVVADFLGGPAVKTVMGAREGEVEVGDDFRVEVLKVMAGSSSSLGRNERGREIETRFDVEDTGGGGSLVVCMVVPEAAGETIELNLLGREGEVIGGIRRRTVGPVVVLGAGVKPEEIVELEVAYRPERRRLLVDLPPLAGVAAGNVGVADLFDCVLPKGEATSEYALRVLVSKAVQLDDPLVWTASHAPVGIYPLDVGGMTVRQVMDEYRRARPDVRVWVDPVEMRLEVVDPVAMPWWKRALWRAGGVFR